MIKRKEDLEITVRSQMKGGPGQVVQTTFSTKEELLNKGRLFGNLHLDQNCGIGYHVHEKETELFYVASGEALYNDNGTEVVVKQGDICVCKPGEGHGVKTNNTTCDLIAVIILED